MSAVLPNPKSDAIRCEAVSLAFKNKSLTQQVLDSLSLTVSQGNITTLLGPSGCGKSTLLRVIAGLIDCDSGDVLIRTEHVSKRMPLSIRHDISFVFQEAALLPWRTVWQNVLLPLELRAKHREQENRARCEELLNIVGFNRSDWTKRPSQLSGGMKMRASIARAMSTSPKILLLDEPFAALDDILRSKLNDLLLSISQRERCTMLFVTHNIAEAIYLSNDIAVMSRGRIAQLLNVPFPFPRESHLRSSPEFAAYYGIVAESLMAIAELSSTRERSRT